MFKALGAQAANKDRLAGPRTLCVSEVDEEISRGGEVVNRETDVLHSLDRHVSDALTLPAVFIREGKIGVETRHAKAQCRLLKQP